LLLARGLLARGLPGRPFEALAAIVVPAFAALRTLLIRWAMAALEARLIARAFPLSRARVRRRNVG
jgi:hypothetical protein